jgi:hypothetical protein
MTDVVDKKKRPVAPFVAAAVGVVLASFFVVLVMAEPGDSTVAKSPLLGRPAPEVTSTVICLAAREVGWR